MTDRNPPAAVTCYRKRYYVTSGVARLSKGFASEALAQAHLDANREFYAYWSSSITVSVQNTAPVIIHAS